MSGRQLVVVTAADRDALSALVEALEADGATDVRGVFDPHRRGNLGGTVAAWRAVRADCPADARVRILHDGGRATRSGWLTHRTAGSRGLLELGLGRPLLTVVHRAARAWTGDPAWVDVHWGSQLALPDAPTPPRGMLCKTGLPRAGTLDASELADLGWMRIDEHRLTGFAPRGRFTDEPGLRAWAGASLAADLGSPSLHRDLLDALVELDVDRGPPSDVDPDLTAPWADALAGLPPSPLIAALWTDARFRDPAALGARVFSGAWVRLRRPDELRDALAGPLRGPAWRALLGLPHPITRSRLGGVWVEGPEFDADAIAHGVEVGGVRVRDAVVVDSALESGSAVEQSWLAGVEGRVQAQRSALIDVRRSGVFERGLAVDERAPSAAALARLDRFAPASDIARLVALCRAGALALCRGPTDGPPTRLNAPRGAGWGRLFIRADRWTDDPRAEAALLLDGLARHLADPGPRGRDALADGLHPDALDAGPVPTDRDRLIDAVAGWTPEVDPLRVRLGALLHALDARLHGPIDAPAALGALWRVLLEHRRLAVGPAWARLAPLAPDADRWVDAGLAMRVGPAVLPLPARHRPRGELDGLLRPGVVLGFAGPAASGKSTRADALAARLRAEGVPVARVHADALTWAGPGFRYVQRASWRDERVEGPGVYDDRAIAAALADARAPDRVVIADGVALGLGAPVDALVVCAVDPRVSLPAKRARDDRPGSGRVIDLETDFARKLFREHTDLLPRLVARADVVLDELPPAMAPTSRPLP